MPIPEDTKGFSLIELMIVVTIISILSIIAIPTYQTYTQRARFTEILTAVEPFKLAVTLALQNGTPANEIALGVHGIPSSPKPTKNLASIDIQDGKIIATATTLANQVTYILSPNEDGTQWIISGTCLAKGWCDG